MSAVRVPVASTEAVVPFSLSHFRGAWSEMEDWLLSGGSAGMPLHEVEQEVSRRGREAMRLALQMHLDAYGTGAVGPALTVFGVEKEASRYVERRKDHTDIETIFGRVEAWRTAYVHEGKASIHPLDEARQLPARSFSYPVQQRVVEEVVRGAYDEGLDSLSRNVGLKICKRSAEQIVRDASIDFDAFYRQRSASAVSPSGPILVASADGKGIPLVKPEGARRVVRRTKGEKANKKKMATVATVFTQVPRVRTAEAVVASLFDEEAPEQVRVGGPEHKRVWASLEKPREDVFVEIAEEMARRNSHQDKLQVMLTDGDPVLERMSRQYLPKELLVLILDFLHVSERLWQAGHAFYGEGTEEAVGWVRKHALMILRGEVSQVIKGMRQSVTKRGLKGERAKAVLKGAAYFYRNRHRMRYDIYLALGLPIASGAVEGACRHLVKDRMERAGMRWVIPGAEAVLKMRALKLSGDFDTYWQFHIQQDQQRLYGNRTWEPVNEK